MSVAPVDPAIPIALGENDGRVPTTDEKDALAGGGAFGTPDAANKFLTEEFITGIKSSKILAAATRATITPSSETNFFSTTVTGGLLGTNNVIKVIIPINDFDFTASSQVLTFRLKYGSTTLVTTTITSSGADTNLKGQITAYLYADASTTAQFGLLDLDFSQNQLSATDYGSDVATHFAKSISTGTSTETSTGDLSLVISIHQTSGSAGANITPAGHIIELIA